MGCEKVAADIRRAFALIKPPKRLRISEWAREHARLKDGSRYHPWPFQIEWLDEMNNPRTSKMTVIKPTRVGYTQVILAGLGYFTAHDPRNVLMVRPTIKDSQKFFKEHVALVLSWPIMKSLNLGKSVFGALRDTITEKYFPGGFIKGVGSESPNGLRDLDVDALILDELDGFALTAGVDGDPEKLAAERLLQSYDPRNIAGSTPTDEAVSKINRRFLASDQRHYHVPCPTCKHMQVLKWGSSDANEPGIKWFPKKAPTEFWYQCEKGCRIPEAKKLWMLENGKWIAKFPEVYERTGHAGFHINALYSLQPNAKWPDLVEKFLDSYKSPVTFKTFVNTTLGEVWRVMGDQPDWKILSDRRDDWKQGIVPYGGCFLTAAVDIQAADGGRLECFVWAHGRGGSSWLVEHKEFIGSPYEAKVWDELTEFVHRKWPHENGEDMLGLERTAVDVAFATRPAYNWCRKMGLDKFVPIRGSQNLNAPPISASTTMELQNKQGSKSKTQEVRVFMIGGHVLKQELYGLLRLEKPTSSDKPYPLGYVHVPKWLDEGTLKELVAEYWHAEKAEWVKTGANEMLDCWCYARAMAIARDMEKWTESQWVALEARYGDPAFVTPLESEQPRITQRADDVSADPDPDPNPQPAKPVETQKQRRPRDSWLFGGGRR